MINEANQDLYGKMYTLPSNVIEFLNTKVNSVEGKQRVAQLLNDKQAAYSQLKYIKHDIENNYKEDWSTLLNWINNSLNVDRSTSAQTKTSKSEIGLVNQHRKEHHKDFNKNPASVKNLIEEKTKMENKKKSIFLTESELKKVIANTIEKAEAKLNESTDFTMYKVSSLKTILEKKKTEVMDLKKDIKTIETLINKKKEDKE